nr:RHS repeat protein [Desulfobacula sp.]
MRGRLEKAEAVMQGGRVVLEAYAYFDNGNPKQKTEYLDKTDPNKKRVTNYIYQDNGLNLQSMTVTGQPENISYTVSFTYDSLGREKSETLTRRTSPTDPALIALTTSYDYDTLGRVIRVTDPLGNIKETVYDMNGKVRQEKVHHKQPGGGFDVRTHVTNTYDAADRLISTTDIDGHVTTYEYDAGSNLVRTTDPNGHITRYEYDAMNRRTAVIDANGNRTQSVYDLGGRLVKIIDANGHAVRFEYDALGRRTREITPWALKPST